MVLSTFLNELLKIKYVKKDEVDAIGPIIDTWEVINKFTYSTVNDIFADKHKIYTAEFRDRVMENYRWILSPQDI